MSRKQHKDRRIRGRELHVMSGRDLAAQKRMKNPLTELTPKVVRNLYETYRKGFMADIQLNWDAIEEYDETLGTVVDRRQSALGEMDWDVRIDQRLVGDNAALQELAEQQRVYMTARFNRVGNLMEAVKWLGMANFRRATFVQVFEQPGVDEEVWRRVPPWCISHPDHEGPWVYDEAAATYPHKADEVLMEHVIFREVERPIDLPCLALVVAKNMGITNWDGFLDTFGIPAVMVKMPPDTTDERREEFMDIAREIIGDGRGVFPDGTEINTIEATQNFANSFTERVDWCDKAMVRRATGGMLTVLAESGSGTLAGSAHMEAFRQLAANDAASVAECINRQYTRRVLAAVFPGQPALVRFDLIPPVTDDRAAQAQILATLAGAGFKPSAEVVSEMMGFEVTEAQPPQTPGMPMLNTAAPSVITNAASVPHAQDRLSEAGAVGQEHLSEAELDALQALASGGLSAEALQGTSQAIADTLQGAISNGCNKLDCEEHPHDRQEEREPWEKRLGELDAADAKEDNLRAAGYDEDTIKRVTGERRALSPEEHEQINRFIDDRPKIKQEILSKIPDGGLKIDLSKQGLSETTYTKKAAREMLSDKAIDASVRNGCPVSAHVEAVRRTPELVDQSEFKGNTAPTKKKNKIDKISHLEAPFQADDKKNYIAHYTVHHPKPNPQQPNKPAGSPRLYFLFIRKGKPE